MRGDARRHTADSFSNLPFGHGVRWARRWVLRRIRANILLPFQILHWAAVCPAGVVHHDDEGGAEVQDGVRRGAGGLHDQAGQHTRQARQHQIHATRVKLSF